MSAIFARLVGKPLVLEVEIAQEHGKRICLGAYDDLDSAESMVYAICEDAGAFHGGNFITTQYYLDESLGDEAINQWILYDMWTPVEDMTEFRSVATPMSTTELAERVGVITKSFVSVQYSRYTADKRMDGVPDKWQLSAMLPWVCNMPECPDNHCIIWEGGSIAELWDTFQDYVSEHEYQFAQLSVK